MAAFLVIVEPLKNKQDETGALDLTTFKKNEGNSTSDKEVHIIPLPPSDELENQKVHLRRQTIKKEEDISSTTEEPKDAIDTTDTSTYHIKKKLMKKYMKESQDNNIPEAIESAKINYSFIKDNPKPREIILDKDISLKIDFSEYDDHEEKYIKDHENWSYIMDIALKVFNQKQGFKNSNKPLSTKEEKVFDHSLTPETKSNGVKKDKHTETWNNEENWKNLLNVTSAAFEEQQNGDNSVSSESSVSPGLVFAKLNQSTSIPATPEIVANDHQYYKTPIFRNRRKQNLRFPSYTSEDSGIHDDDIEINDSNMISLGKNNTKISQEVYKSLNLDSCTAMTRKLLTTLFDREVLANRSLTGKCSPAFLDRNMIAKPQLDEKIVSDIVDFVMANCKTATTKTEVRQAITTKLADENKLLRKRLSKGIMAAPKKSAFSDEWTPKNSKLAKSGSKKRKRESI